MIISVPLCRSLKSESKGKQVIISFSSGLLGLRYWWLSYRSLLVFVNLKRGVISTRGWLNALELTLEFFSWLRYVLDSLYSELDDGSSFDYRNDDCHFCGLLCFDSDDCPDLNTLRRFVVLFLNTRSLFLSLFLPWSLFSLHVCSWTWSLTVPVLVDWWVH